MAKGFYKAPYAACEPICLFDYGDISAGPVQFVGDLDGWRFFYVGNDEITIPTSDVASFVPVVLDDELKARLHGIAPADMRDLIIPPLNLPLFFESFAKATLDGIFTMDQWRVMQLLRDITDVAYRDQKIIAIAGSATDLQVVKLLELASQAGFTLPLDVIIQMRASSQQ